jgi:MFS family permease
MTVPRPSRSRARWVTFMLFTFTAISFSDKAVLGLVAAPISKELHLSATQFGAVASSFYVLFIVSAVVIGFVGNRVSSKWLLVVLVLIWSAAQLPILFSAAGFVTLVATRILLGVGEGPSLALANHTAFSWVPAPERGLSAAVIATGASAGVFVGAPLLQWSINDLGWRSAFGFLGLVGVAWVLAWLVVGGVGPHDIEPDDSLVGSRRVAAPSARQPYRRLLLSGTWLGATLGSFSVFWSLALGMAFLPLYLGSAGFSPTSISFLVGLPGLLSVVLVLSGGGISQRLVKRGVSRRLAQGAIGGVGVLVSGVTMLAMSQVHTGVLVVVLMTMGFAAGSAMVPLSSAAIADFVPVGQRAAMMGMWYGAASIGSIAAPYVSGLLIDSAPSPAVGYERMFILAGVLLVAGGLAAMLLMRADQDAARLTARTERRAPDQTATAGSVG